MSIDWTINMSTVVVLLGSAIGAVVAWVTLRNQVAAHDAKFAEQDKKFEGLGISYSAMQATHGMMGERVEEIRAKGAHELAEFKLEVAKNYATNTAIREVEERIVVAIDRLGDRLDKLIDGQNKPARTRRAS